MSTTADSFDRNITLQLNGEGYILTIQDDLYRLTPGEAMSLLTSLLHAMPEVVDGVAIAQEIRWGPRLVIEEHWSAEKNTISQNKFRGVVYVKEQRVDRTPLCDSKEEARALASRRYGKELTVAATMPGHGSRHLALKKANEWIITDFLAGSNMTVPQLFQAIKAGELPDGLSLEVVEI